MLDRVLLLRTIDQLEDIQLALRQNDPERARERVDNLIAKLVLVDRTSYTR